MPLSPPPQIRFAFCIASRGTVSLAWAQRFRGIAVPMNCAAIMCSMIDVAGGEVAEARNACTQQALKRGATHLFWLDDDVCPSRFAIVSLFRRMKEEPARQIVSGVYFTKPHCSEPLIFPGPGAGTSPFLAQGTCEAWAHGMGLVLIKADLYREMLAKIELPRDKYGHIEFYKTIGPEEAFVTEIEGNVNVTEGSTEDFYFLKLAEKLGHKPLVDMTPEAFGWHVDIETRRGFPEEQYNQMLAGEPIVWNTPQGKVTWNDHKWID